MSVAAVPSEPTVVRRVFPSWSIELPESFAETFVEDDSYWHAYTTDRSVSMTSLQITDGRRPVRASEIMREMRKALAGTPVEGGPDGLLCHAVFADAPRSSRASRLLSGLIASDGRALLVTITSDDQEWAYRTWRSIKRHAALPGDISGAVRRAARSRPKRRRR